MKFFGKLAVGVTALAAVIEENEMRQALSPWERGRIVLLAHEQEYFDTIEASASALFPTASKARAW